MTRASRVTVFTVLPVVAMIIAAVLGYLRWQDGIDNETRRAGVESVTVASEGTVDMLSYQPNTAAADLSAARDRLTGELKDSYAALTNDVVVPGSRQKEISAVAKVTGAASVSASPKHAVVLVFVNQTVTMASNPPTDTASRVRVTLDKIDGRWLIAGFDPI